MSQGKLTFIHMCHCVQATRAGDNWLSPANLFGFPTGAAGGMSLCLSEG
jgi:hypothetical protein